MADNDSFRRKRRLFEDDDDSKDDDFSLYKGAAFRDSAVKKETGDAEKFLKMINEAQVLIDQLNNLYHLYIQRVERRPPLEKRAALENLMQRLQKMEKGTQAQQFRYTSIQAHYLTYRDRWDKLLRDFESGKISR